MAQQFLASLIAGDTLKLTFDLLDYPAADGWAMVYTLKGPATITLTATLANDLYQVLAAAATTAAWTPGLYVAYATLSKDGESYTLPQGQMEIKAALNAAGAVDPRSTVKKTLDALEAMILGKAGQDAQDYTINGRSLSRYTPAELMKWRDHYAELYRQEQRREAANRGEIDSSRIVAVRFP